MSEATSASFTCQVCGGEAARLELSIADDRPALISSGFMGTVTEYLDTASQTERRAALRDAIAKQSAPALYRLDSLLAPFYCPECDCCYCRDHWTITPQFDDDFPGWYDCSYGICPQGHRRLVDD